MLQAPSTGNPSHVGKPQRSRSSQKRHSPQLLADLEKFGRISSETEWPASDDSLPGMPYSQGEMRRRERVQTLRSPRYCVYIRKWKNFWWPLVTDHRYNCI